MGRGNKPIVKPEIILPDKLHCLCCNKEFDSKIFYSSNSDIYKSLGKIPYCKECIEDMYKVYFEKYNRSSYVNPERKAVERLCMMFDIYYNDKIFDSALKEYETKIDIPLVVLYIKNANLYQYRKKNYDTTISEKFKSSKEFNNGFSIYEKDDQKYNEMLLRAKEVFGSGFKDEDYEFLIDQYNDWTSRHECETKSQEEIFKQICFTQLELQKMAKVGADTKDLNYTFLKQLEAAKLQPKQNYGETSAEVQTFGTLIDKWENTKPIPEIDEELRDVDKIGLFLDVFFKGHLSKMMGLKNGMSKLYTKFMKKYTVERPEYNDDEDGEALFDAIFGNVSLDDD